MAVRCPALLTLIVLAALVGCGGRPAPKPENEFAQMRREALLSPEQEVAFSAKVAARDAALRAWHDGPDGKRLLAARSERTAATDPAKRAELDAEITRLNQSQWKVRSEYRAEVLAVLNPDQQRRWAGARLGERLVMIYAKLELDQGQQERARVIAAEVVDGNLPDGAVVRDPYLSTALEPARQEAMVRVEAEVLTDAQRATLRELRAAHAAKAGVEAQ